MRSAGTRGLVAAAVVSMVMMTHALADDLDEAAALMDAGWLDDAEAIINRLIEHNPDNAEFYYQMARLYLTRDDAQSANGGAPWDNLNQIERYAERAIALDPSDARFYVVYGHGVGLKAMRGGTVKKFSRAKTAKSRYERAADMDPANIEARTSLIEYHMQAPGIAGGDKKEALRLAAVVAQLDSAAGFDAWKTIYLHEQNYDALEAAVRSVIESQPQGVKGYIELALLCQRREDVRCAIENLQRVVSLQPHDVQSYWHLSRIYAREGKEEEAEAALLSAVRSNLHEARVYRWVADFHRDRERWDDAIAWYQQCLEVDPGYARAWYDMGDTYLRSQRDLELAQDCFNTYLQSRLNCRWPEPALAHCQLAKIHAKNGDKKAAKRELKAAKQLNPDNDEVRRTAKQLHIR
jgi:tetratricopeptide (TPR) repeat protein